MTKQQIIQRLDKIREEIIFPSCPEDFTPLHRLGRVSQQLQDLIGDIELDLEPCERGPEVRLAGVDRVFVNSENKQHGIRV